MNHKIRTLTEREKLEYLKVFLEEQIRIYEKDLEEVKVKLKSLEKSDE